jgi:hypothetical protein
MGGTIARRRLVALTCSVLVVAALGTACGKTNVGGCTDIGCDSAILAEFPINTVGAGAGAVVARVCLDGTCRTARGVLDPHTTRFGGTRGDHVFQSGIEVRLNESSISVQLRLPDEPYDDVTSHDMLVELQVAGNQAVTLEEERKFTRSNPNGVNCEPTCWFADLSPSTTSPDA